MFLPFTDHKPNRIKDSNCYRLPLYHYKHIQDYSARKRLNLLGKKRTFHLSYIDQRYSSKWQSSDRVCREEGEYRYRFSAALPPFWLRKERKRGELTKFPASHINSLPPLLLPGDGRQLLDLVALVIRSWFPTSFPFTFLPISFPFLDSMMHLCWIDLGSKQLLDPDKVDVVQRLDKEKGLTLEEFRLIKIHMSLRKLISSLPSHPLTWISRFFLAFVLFFESS
ncbi:hypothetical protein GW17_00027997 [Ensete ventricosum]|nr:hypothetical protein GW17_00027997 [Ensete ventricosum]